MAHTLGMRLREAGVVSEAQLEAALQSLPDHGGALITALVQCGVDESLLCTYFEQHVPPADPAELAQPDPDALSQLSAPMAAALIALPIACVREGLVVAMAAPTDGHVVAELERWTGTKVLPRAAHLGAIREGLARSYGDALAEADARRSKLEDVAVPLVRKRTSSAPRIDQTGKYGAVDVSDASPVSESAPSSAARQGRAPEAVFASAPKAAHPRSDGKPPALRATSAESAHDGSAHGTTAPGAGRAWGGKNKSPAGDNDDAPGHRTMSPDSWAGLEALGGGRSRASELPRRRSSRPSAAPTSAGSSAPPGAFRASVVPERESVRPETPKPMPPGDVGYHLEQLRLVTTQAEALQLACDGAVTVGRAAVFLAWRDGVLHGRHVVGGGVTEQAVRSLVLPASGGSVLARAAQRSEPYVGPYGTGAADQLLRVTLGAGGARVCLCPVRVRDRVTGILAVHDMRYGPPGTQRVELLAHTLGDALARLLLTPANRD